MQLGTIRVLIAAAIAVACLGVTVTGCAEDEPGVADATEQFEADPPEDPTDVDDPTKFAFGQEVTIIDGSVEPRLLAADVKAPILIRNGTDTTQEIRFTNPGWDEATTTTTGPLEPGATFELDPIGVASITYELVGAEGVTGTIQVEDGLDTL